MSVEMKVMPLWVYYGTRQGYTYSVHRGTQYQRGDCDADFR